MIYQIAFIMLLIFIVRYDINGKTRYRNECYFVMLVIFILIAGLRYRLGVDTTRYITRFYYETPELQNITWSDLEFGTDPFYTLLNSVVLTFGGKFYVVQLLHATFVNTLIFKYIKKHTDAIFISIFIYFIWQYAMINMEEMRAGMSLAVCLFANDYMLNKKWVKGILLYVIGCFFHVSTILVMLMPLLFSLRLNKIGISVMAIALVLGFTLQSYISDYVTLIEIQDTVDRKAEKYANSEKFMENNKNIIGYLVTMIMYGYSVVSLWCIKTAKIDSRLKRLEPLMMIYLIFTMLNTGLFLAYRFQRFYVIYNIMFVSEFMAYLFRWNPNSRLRRNVIYVKALAIMFPLFFLIAKTRLDNKNWVRYHPYSSIYDQQLDQKREGRYSELGGDRPVPGKY